MNRRPRKPQSLQIAFWNGNGLTTKKTEMEEFVQRHQLDSVLIGETHLRASNGFSLRYFRVHRTDREGARGGGTPVLIKSTIDHHAELALDLHNIEATAITVNLATSPIKLVAAYKAPNRQFLEDDLSEIFNTRRPQRQTPIVELEADERKRHLSTPFCRRLPPPGGRYRRAHDIPA
ncbi:hypothetical protein Trydic_g645 [Trypoxylus dichotomus]